MTTESNSTSDLAAPPKPRPTAWTSGTFLFLMVTWMIGLRFAPHVEPRAPEGDLDCAGRFVRFVHLGLDFDEDDSVRNGYVRAWELLDDVLQEQMPPEQFLGYWDDLAARHKVLQSIDAQPRVRRSFIRRELEYTMRYSGAVGREDILKLRLVVERGAQGYRVSSFHCEPIDGIR